MADQTQPTGSTAQQNPMDQYLQYLESQKRPQAFSDIASIFGSFSEGERAGRQGIPAQLQAQDYLKLAARADQRTAEGDAWKKLMSTSYLTGTNAMPQTGPVTLRGRQIPTGQFSRGEIPEAARQGAESVQGMLLARLAPGAGLQPTDISPYLKAGTGEKIGNVGALVTGGLGIADSLGLLKKIPGLGKLFGAGGAGTIAGLGSAGGQLGMDAAMASAAGTGAAAGGMGAGLGAFFTNPWTIGIGAALAAAPFIKKAFGPSDAYKAREKQGEWQRNLGDTGLKNIQALVNQGVIPMDLYERVINPSSTEGFERDLAALEQASRGEQAVGGASSLGVGY